MSSMQSVMHHEMTKAEFLAILDEKLAPIHEVLKSIQAQLDTLSNRQESFAWRVEGLETHANRFFNSMTAAVVNEYNIVKSRFISHFEIPLTDDGSGSALGDMRPHAECAIVSHQPAPAASVDPWAPL
ncbi:hypothetical protein LZL87_007051 [Fusarium oxysporum]|nr:hypothetical protein LZL87_007051 [Fusarium oxysporum]